MNEEELMSGYLWHPDNQWNGMTWNEEVKLAKGQGYQLLKPDEMIEDPVYTVRENGNVEVSHIMTGRLAKDIRYPIYKKIS